MLVKLARKIFAIYLVLISPIFASTDDSFESCLKFIAPYLDKSSGTLEDYIKEAEDTARNHGHKGPLFKNMMEDQHLLTNMTGSKGPYLFTKTLPPDTYFIDHPLFLPTEPGVVKTSTGGEAVPLRALVNYKGKKIGTNVLTLRNALFDNIFRNENKSLIPKDAKAVFIFMHGGGTKTTGSHVGISVANHLNSYGIATLSIDLPWHAEGPREFFKDAKDFFGWLRAFIKQFALAPNCPIILGGHSMGGEFADMYMRTYPNDDLVSGVVSLSPPVDPTPGKSIYERLVSHENGYSNTSDVSDLNKDNLQILDDILLDGKNSPSGLYFEGQISANNDWKIPEDNGESFLPALYVWGKADYLYVGYENHIEKYVNSLKNTEVKIYGERTVISGEKEVIGHLIFDHFSENSEVNELEAYSDIRKFIEKILNQDLEKVSRSFEPAEANFLKVIKEYSYNLAFREFVKNAKIIKKRPNDTEKLKEISTKINELSKTLKNSSELSSEEKMRLKKNEKKFQALRAGKYIPNGPDGDVGRQLERFLEKISEEINIETKKNKRLRDKIEKIQKELKISRHEFNEELNFAIRVADPDSKKVYNEYQNAIEVLTEKSRILDLAINLHLRSIYKKTNSPTSEELIPTKELQELFSEYETFTYPNFLKSKSEYENYLISMAKDGLLGKKIESQYKKIVSLEAELSILTEDDKHVQMIIFEGGNIIDALKAAILDLYNNDLYRVETYDFRSILDLEYDEIKEFNFAIQDYWTKWKHLWKDRNSSDSISLY